MRSIRPAVSYPKGPDSHATSLLVACLCGPSTDNEKALHATL
jgi:hypothetical protein